MTDIFGRSNLIRTVGRIVKNHIKKLDNINLVNVDPGELVVFENQYGKLRTSNIRLTDIVLNFSIDSLSSRIVQLNGHITNIIARIEQLNARISDKVSGGDPLPPSSLGELPSDSLGGDARLTNFERKLNEAEETSKQIQDDVTLIDTNQQLITNRISDIEVKLKTTEDLVIHNNVELMKLEAKYVDLKSQADRVDKSLTDYMSTATPLINQAAIDINEINRRMEEIRKNLIRRMVYLETFHAARPPKREDAALEAADTR